MAYFRSQYTGWYYAAAVPLEHYNVSEPLMTEYWFYIVITLVFIFILTALFVSFYLIRPMKQISDKMREAEHGDLDVRIHTRRRDELGYIGHRLNVLLKNIDSLIHTNYETRLLKEGYELKFIQTQLKEHFIYNTLDSIHWIADKNNVPQISKIIFDLSRFFRLTLNNGSDYITIEREAEVLASYLSLLNVRMDGTIESSIEMDDSIRDQRVIKYFFQPVLENAVVHGLRPKGGRAHHGQLQPGGVRQNPLPRDGRRGRNHVYGLKRHQSVHPRGPQRRQIFCPDQPQPAAPPLLRRQLQLYHRQQPGRRNHRVHRFPERMKHMIKAMIIDDEKLIREGLVTYIDWAALGVEVCAVCGDCAGAVPGRGPAPSTDHPGRYLPARRQRPGAVPARSGTAG